MSRYCEKYRNLMPHISNITNLEAMRLIITLQTIVEFDLRSSVKTQIYINSLETLGKHIYLRITGSSFEQESE